MYIYISGIVTPTDFHIFQRGRYTTNQQSIGNIWEVWGVVQFCTAQRACLQT